MKYLRKNRYIHEISCVLNTPIKEKGTKHKRKAAKTNDIFFKKIARLIPLNFVLNFALNFVLNIALNIVLINIALNIVLINIALNIVLNFASITNPHILP